MSRFVRLVTAAALAAAVPGACGSRATPTHDALPALLGTSQRESTSRQALGESIAAMRERLAIVAEPDAAIRLADALLRQTRVAGNAGLAREAESALRAVLDREPEHYGACRMLAAVLVSQHRFAEARAQAERCRQWRPDDAWLFGVLGDAHLELGDYDAAFDAFDAMMALRPDEAAYARASYARELQGDLDGALRLMQMALSATPPADPEALAWHHVQIGHLELTLGRIRDAERSFARAGHAFPDHPMVIEGLTRVLVARGELRAALDTLAPHVSAMPTPDGLALEGDLLMALGRGDEAERSYRLAEAAWTSDAPEPSRLARFLAGRGRRLDDAIDLARREATVRNDIFTLDALAWALFRSGRVAEAAAAIEQALRLGTRDRIIRYHAAAIDVARGERRTARIDLDLALSGSPNFDLVAAPEARLLLQGLADVEDDR